MDQEVVTYWVGRPDLSWQWLDFFADHTHVAYVEVMLPCDYTQDVDVFFTDSTEPFALSSLRLESPVKQALMALLDL